MDVPNKHKKGLYELVNKQFGIETTIDTDPLIISLPAALTKVVNSNPQRIGLIMMNLGATGLYLAPDNRVSVTRGIYLAANGGIVSFRWDVDFVLCSYEWYGISVVAANDFFTIEVKTL